MKKLPGGDELGQDSSKCVYTHNDRKTVDNSLTSDYFVQCELKLAHHILIFQSK